MAPVTLHIYDVSTNPEIASLNKYLTAVGTGAFHGAVEVYGQEWSYGFTPDGTGIFHNAPKACSMHHYRESVDLDETHMSEADVLKLVKEMEPQWPGKDYDLLRRNCVFFSAEFARRLGAKEVPKWVTNLAGAGATIQDGAMQAATAAQAAAIMAAAKASEINAKYDITGQAAAKVQDMLKAAADLDEKHRIQDRAQEAAQKAGTMAVEGAHHAAVAAQRAIFKVNELAEKHHVKEKIEAFVEKAHHRLAEFDEKHHIREKAGDVIERGEKKVEGMCGACTVM